MLKRKGGEKAKDKTKTKQADKQIKKHNSIYEQILISNLQLTDSLKVDFT